MKRVKTAELVPGMVIAEDVYSYSNQLIMPKGLILSDKSITKLEFYSIINVRVEDDSVATAEAQVIDDRSYAERFRESEEFIRFKQNYEQEIGNFRDSINSVVSNNSELDADDLLDHTLGLINSGDSAVDIFSMLHNLRSYDDATFVHSMNVALICNVFARWLRMSEEDVKLATLCGLLHDLGKVFIPESIITKPAKLTDKEYEIVKTHPQHGYNLLKERGANTHIMNSALMHHERCDGSGYPLGLKDSQIDSFAKLVAIADVYDAITSARVYRGPLCPFTAIQIFESEGLQKYDPQYIMTFLSNVVNTYLLNRVRLSNGVEGEIIYINKDKYSCPTIKVGNKFIDLSKEPGITIEALI